MTTAAVSSEGQQWIPSSDSVVLSNRPLRPNAAAVSRFRDDRWELGRQCSLRSSEPAASPS